MTSAPIADDFTAIREALERLERDKKEAEAPKAWPDYAAAEASEDHFYSMYTGPWVRAEDGQWHQAYLAPDSDPA